MKKILFTLYCFSSLYSLSGQVIISDTDKETPEASAILELNSTNKGFLPPRLTKEQREKIENPSNGLMIYLVERDVQCLQIYDGVGWADIYCPEKNSSPRAENVNISGNPLVGSTLTGSYSYVDKENDKESNSMLGWYSLPDAKSTDYTSLGNSTSTYEIKESDLDKFIVFAVTPMAVTGNQQGATSYSSVLGPVTKAGITPTPPDPQDLIANINEFHYDNAGDDKNEFIEIRVKGSENNQPSDIGDYKIIRYNKDGTLRGGSTETFSELNKSCDASYCYYVWENRLNNGKAGLALVNATGSLLEFWSYGGTFQATSGEAAGHTSIDVGVKENNNNTPLNSSIYLDQDNTWKLSEGKNTKGQANY